MTGTFVMSAENPPEELDWGKLRWVSRPPTTNAEKLTVIEVNITPGNGHNFHKHPNQEEVIYVLEGEIEQWLDTTSRVLKPGDSIFIDADVVHASFNDSNKPARILAILGPCVGEAGYELVPMDEEVPWSTLRP